MKPVEIEIDGPRNESWHFPPGGFDVRGRFDLLRVAEPMARSKSHEWPSPIPSQRLGVDESGCGYLVESLHEPEFAALREKIESIPKKLPPAKRDLGKVTDEASWVYWLKRAVESGLAKITKGSLPKECPGEPKLDYHLANVRSRRDDKLALALGRLADVLGSREW